VQYILTISTSATYISVLLDITYTAITTGFNKYMAYVKRDRGRNPLQDKMVLKIPIKYQRTIK